MTFLCWAKSEIGYHVVPSFEIPLFVIFSPQHFDISSDMAGGEQSARTASRLLDSVLVLSCKDVRFNSVREFCQCDHHPTEVVMVVVIFFELKAFDSVDGFDVFFEQLLAGSFHISYPQCKTLGDWR